jgi:hypothetical protein
VGAEHDDVRVDVACVFDDSRRRVARFEGRLDWYVVCCDHALDALDRLLAAAV